MFESTRVLKLIQMLPSSLFGYRLTARIRLRLIEGYTCMGID